ncbi:MAG: metallophosphoesterase [Bacteroidetes bacterium]|nr:metallophosphoesterase [Bacteroidota bacterium]
MTSIKFLHLSDIHIGDKHQKGLISQTKKVLFEDIDHIISKTETLDIVFFTGDLVQKGTKEEFIMIEDFLIDLWKLFNTHNLNPYLLCVPGNHDLERIEDLNDPVQKVMMNWIIEDIKDEYFWKSPNDYHSFIKNRFKNYTEWYKNTSIRKPENILEGYIPGDFCCSININDVTLGVVGLNSTFLQLCGGDFKQKLGVYNNQINNLFEENYFEWLKKQDLSILLTHHSPEWFEPKSLDDFHQEIYCEGTFLEHLCGHMHETSYTKTSINGYPSKRLFISPSLFGLEYIHEKSSVKRIHGYTAGVYNFQSGKISKTIWPRVSFQTNNGIKISQNEEFNLEKSNSSYTEVFNTSQARSIDDNLIIATQKTDVNSKAGNLFANETVLDKGLARTLYKEVNSHKGIRLTERNISLTNLKNKNYCWIVTTYGLGEDEFIGSILQDASINSENCFSINCDEVSNQEEIIELFKSTFSHNITQFFDIINSLNRPVVVLNHLNANIVNDASILKGFIQPIIDFSPNTKIIIVSEVPPRQHFEFIELLPLDVPAVKHYIENSQELLSTFTFLEYEKIHRISSGIPLYIDRVIEQLKFRPLSDLGDMEFDNSSNEDNDAILSKTLASEINILNLDETKEGSRRFNLLSILSLLHNGETFDRIRRYYPNTPFYPDDISYLLKNKFIETIQINSIFDGNQNDRELIKIIRVPRIIRDYINSLVSEDEKLKIYRQACSLYLGKNWRTKIKLIQPKDAELDLIVHQNLQIAIRFILLFGIENKNSLEVNRITRISKSLIEYLSERGAYKDAISLTEETLLLIKDTNFDGIESTRTHLMRKLGENLRMTSIYDQSLSILKSICDDEKNNLNKSDRNDIRLSIAYAYETQNNKEEAIKYATLIKQNENNKESSIYLSAESVIIHFIEDNTEKLKKLNAIKNKAEKLGFNTLKANIIFDICLNTRDNNQIKQLDKIIAETKNSTYNKVRAFVAKADIILNTKDIDKITPEDLLGLNISYSYSFYQRLQTLLNKCHKLAWQYWSKQNRYDQLLNLFRYSSFVWRLCGESDQEQKYIDELHLDPKFIEWFKSNRNGINSSYYEQRIFTLYNIEKT